MATCFLAKHMVSAYAMNALEIEVYSAVAIVSCALPSVNIIDSVAQKAFCRHLLFSLACSIIRYSAKCIFWGGLILIFIGEMNGIYLPHW